MKTLMYSAAVVHIISLKLIFPEEQQSYRKKNKFKNCVLFLGIELLMKQTYIYLGVSGQVFFLFRWLLNYKNQYLG